jgi:hypothetical protein
MRSSGEVRSAQAIEPHRISWRRRAGKEHFVHAAAVPSVRSTLTIRPDRDLIGIRMALGADKGAVLNLVLRSAFTRVAIGLGPGVPLAIGAGKLLAAQLYGVKFWDPVALAVATGSLDSVRRARDAWHLKKLFALSNIASGHND